MKQLMVIFLIIISISFSIEEKSNMTELRKKKPFNRKLTFQNFSFKTRYAALYTVIQKTFGSKRYPRFIFYNVKNKCNISGKYKKLKKNLKKVIKELERIEFDIKKNTKMKSKFNLIKEKIEHKNNTIIKKKIFLSFSYRRHKAIRNFFLNLLRPIKKCKSGMRKLRSGIKLFLYDFNKIPSETHKGKLILTKAEKFIKELYMIIVKHKLNLFGRYRTFSLKIRHYLGNSRKLVKAAGKLIGNYLKTHVKRLIRKYKKKTH